MSWKLPFSVFSEWSVGWDTGALSGSQLPCRHLKLGEMTLLQVCSLSRDCVERSTSLSGTGNSFLFLFKLNLKTQVFFHKRNPIRHDRIWASLRGNSSIQGPNSYLYHSTCVLTPLIQAPPCWSRVERRAQWRLYFPNKLCPELGSCSDRSPARGRDKWQLGSTVQAPSVRWVQSGGASAAGGEAEHRRPLTALPGTAASLSALWSLHWAVWNNRRRLLLLCCPTGDAVGGFTVRVDSNLCSAGLNRPGVTQTCSYTADFTFSALPKSLQSKQTFGKIQKKSLAPECSSCPADWWGQECTGCSPTAEQKDDPPCLFWSLPCKSDSIDQRQSPGG